MEIPYVDLSLQHSLIKDELLLAVTKVIDSGKFILSSIVEEFETAFAAQCGTHFALGVNSGTDALLLVMRALGIGRGDEVITVPNSYITSTSSIVMLGATPVFVDVQEDYTINSSEIEKVITSKTKAILPVHLTGYPANMSAIMQVAKKYNLHVIEDCAQAVLAKYNGQSVGSFGNAGCFSFHPLKTLNACGDGGAIVTNDEIMYNKLKLLRNNGSVDREHFFEWSSNSRLDSIQASILLTKLKYIQTWTDARRRNAEFYFNHLNDIAEIKLPDQDDHCYAVYHTFVIQAERRNELKKFLTEHGVGTAIHYSIPIHLQKCATELGYKNGDFPIAEAQAAKIITLPIYPELTQDNLKRIVELIHKFYRV